MGIPKFFKWLTRRYPQILLDVKREEQVPPIDNLYLDLNGIVHNCIHGNDAKLHERVSQLDNFEEVWINIMKAIDELVHTIKPKKILFLAVDGVAPRAKMNQQRARRFRTARDSQMLRDKLQKEGKQAPTLFDSNAISPGTKFMEELSRQLDFFVQYKQNTDPLYQNLEKVILSDAFVPGEGEHKMMDYIRQAKHDPNYDPNTRHCFYGADADLIMLSLLTHEPNFIILREEHVVRKIKQGGVQRLDLKRTNNYQVMFINLLREYFMLEYRSIAPRMRMKFDLERIIDDFVFFCFFIGNDFLPSLSALDIGEGSLDSIIELYKRLLPGMDNYITEEGRIYWDRAEPFIKMLGEHEHESFKNRISKIGAMRDERLISFDPEFQAAQSQVNRAQLVQQRIREKLNEKKRKKILGYSQKNKDKQMKKFLLLKRFEEDEINQSLTMKQRQYRDLMLIKYKKIRDKQVEDQNVQSQGDPISEETKKVENLKEIIAGIKEEYFSDLNIDDIEDEDVSDISESDINIEDVQEQNMNSELENKVQVTLDLQDKYEKQNFEFMQEFIQIYQNEPERAKAMYYRAKVKFDITTNEGRSQKRKMLMKYLEGLQWVLYYYYRGAQHWRWYYPYHYAPMISDLDENIVTNFLGGKRYIDQFEIDHNCAQENTPYTPFQQLLSILPIKSLHLLPQQYSKIVLGELRQYFPDDFDIDLNGRTLAYEAACLIPFCDEKLFIQQEQSLLREHSLNPEETERNIVTFDYKVYTYDHLFKQNQVIRPLPLESTLPSFKGLEYNYVKMNLSKEYEKVGQFQFESKLLKGVKQPCHDFPSFTYLNIQEIGYDEKVLHETVFQRVLLKVPLTKEDAHTENLEAYINGFIRMNQKEVYVDFPFQQEAFPTLFENQEFTYTVYGDDISQIYKIHRDRQVIDEEKYDMMKKRSIYKLQDQGFDVGEPNAFVSFNKVTDVSFDSRHNQYYKVYSQYQELLPLSMVIRRRDPYHYQNVNLRCAQYVQSFKPNSQIACLNTHFFGVIGKVQQIDLKNKKIKIQFDKREEQNKIHDPFMGQKCLQNKDQFVPLSTRRYYSDHMIESELKLKPGIVNRLTGSLLITFNDKQTFERQVIDLGLNLKNYTKKAHIPDYVRYVIDEDVADNQFDDYNHNYHARGAKHVRKHWEYSEECLEIIKEYTEKYPFIISVIIKTMKNNKSMLTLKDVFGKNALDDPQSQTSIKEIASWIEQLPTSNLPYVEMGFDALNSELIQMINDQSKIIKETYRKVQLGCKDVEVLDPSFLFQEQFPYWSLPFNNRKVDDYRIGDRVMNVRSVKREYIPFGLRGTVVGKTNDKVIVMFDEQYLNGNNIYGHCENYRGGFIEPNHLINLTKRFNSIMNSNYRIAQSFQERPVPQEGQMEEEQILIGDQYNPEDEQVQRADEDPSKTWIDVNQKPKIIRNQKPANIMLGEKPSTIQQRQEQHLQKQVQQRQQQQQRQGGQQEELKSMDDGVEFKTVNNQRQQRQDRPNQQKQWYNKDTPQYRKPHQQNNQYQIQRGGRQQQQQRQQPYQQQQNVYQPKQKQQQQPVVQYQEQQQVQQTITQQEVQIRTNTQIQEEGTQINTTTVINTSTTTQQLSGFVPSQNQMRDYFYDDNEEYYQEDYYQEQPDQRVEEEHDLNPDQAASQFNALQNNPDFQQLLNMMNIAQQLQGANIFGGAAASGAPVDFANAPNPFANMFGVAQPNLDLNAQEFTYQQPTQQQQEEKKEDNKQ